ncbi:MAG: sodium:solute symporter [Bacteroides sp.]|nr:sodium:solute symporter [Bacteroides sp.]MCM1380067.1 sodium:solute symporter [Bacteroides sp.]MCM1446404.1 sodium:solute symporter [Prevotella sp.]
MLILITLIIYFSALYAVSRLSGRGATNEAFYGGGRRSPWYMVAFGMVGASVSGVSFVSVPGTVVHSAMTYLQTCLGFILGYFAVAFILLPLYYRHNLTSIYSYLGTRFGRRAHSAGAWIFLVTKMIMAAVRFYVVCIIIQRFVLEPLGVPFAATVCTMVALIWLYTRSGGIKTLVWTDSFQTLCLLVAIVLIFVNVAGELNLTFGDAVSAVAGHPMSRVFVFDDWMSPANFWKQFVSGMFIVVVMTGLDQDMMQKNLTCKSLKEARKDMCSYGFAFVPVNLMLMALGVLLVMLAEHRGVALPAASDDILPMFAATGSLGITVVVLFTIGLVASSFSSADSALTSITTSWCIDICRRKDDERLRKRTHLAVCVLFVVFILMFRSLNSTSVIDAIYIICSYSYGPLLGMYAFGLLTRRSVNDRLTPYIAVASPLICFAADTLAQRCWGYKFGYELLLLNGLITFAGLWLSGVGAYKFKTRMAGYLGGIRALLPFGDWFSKP